MWQPSNVAYHTYLKKGSEHIEVEPNVAYETVITNSCTQNESILYGVALIFLLFTYNVVTSKIHCM